VYNYFQMTQALIWGEAEAMSEETREKNEACCHLSAIVHGRVQGVNFRYFTARRARELGLTGYVRNRWDRTVEVVAEGERAAVEKLLEFIKVGPPAARVAGVDTQWSDYSGQYKRFEVRY
jgi:acylphosphatase